MPTRRFWRGNAGAIGLLLAAALTLAASTSAARAQETAIESLVGAVVHLKTHINPDGKSVANLGREREGSAILIDESGLILTIGYLMLEAHAAEVVTNAGRTVPASVVGYDNESGFGLLRTIEPLKIKPIALGKSADLREQDPVLVASYGGTRMLAPVHVVSRRVFAGSWEYMVENAIFTAPAHPAWSGAALINQHGKLVGVGALIVGDSTGENTHRPGNMFVPIDLLPPILGDLLADGRISGKAKPWLGVNANELAGRLFVDRVTPQSPAEKSGLRRGDIIVGIGGDVTRTLPEFYRKLWSVGAAGATIPLDVMHGHDMRRVDVKSVNRLDQLKLKSSF